MEISVNMKENEALIIAKKAYKNIKQAIDEFEKDGIIHAHWDECISVDEYFFTSSQLRDDNGSKVGGI